MRFHGDPSAPGGTGPGPVRTKDLRRLGREDGVKDGRTGEALRAWGKACL